MTFIGNEDELEVKFLLGIVSILHSEVPERCGNDTRGMKGNLYRSWECKRGRLGSKNDPTNVSGEEDSLRSRVLNGKGQRMVLDV